jgi:hypothetical protein
MAGADQSPGGRRRRAGSAGLAAVFLLMRDPLLRGCLKALADGPKTPAQVADHLGEDIETITPSLATLTSLGWIG